MLAYVVFPAKRNLTNQPSFASDTSNPSPEFLTTMTTPRSSPRDPRQEVSVTVSPDLQGYLFQSGAKHHRRQVPNSKTPKTPTSRYGCMYFVQSPYIGNFNAIFASRFRFKFMPIILATKFCCDFSCYMLLVSSQ